MIFVLLGLVVVAILIVISAYNGLVTRRNHVGGAFSQIDVQLKRRYDLIPNLVETAKGYLKHERETLEAVIAARNQAVTFSKAVSNQPTDGESMNQLVRSEGALQAAMSKMFALSESYPDLKSNTTMNSLMEELSSTENKISFARQAYNDAVLDYNNSRETFPNVLLAGPLQFKAATYFEVVAPQEREAIKVSF